MNSEHDFAVVFYCRNRVRFVLFILSRFDLSYNLSAHQGNYVTTSATGRFFILLYNAFTIKQYWACYARGIIINHHRVMDSFRVVTRFGVCEKSTMPNLSAYCPLLAENFFLSKFLVAVKRLLSKIRKLKYIQVITRNNNFLQLIIIGRAPLVQKHRLNVLSGRPKKSRNGEI